MPYLFTFNAYPPLKKAIFCVFEIMSRNAMNNPRFNRPFRPKQPPAAVRASPYKQRPTLPRSACAPRRTIPKSSKPPSGRISLFRLTNKFALKRLMRPDPGAPPPAYRRLHPLKHKGQNCSACAPQFFQIINAALFCAALSGNQKLGRVSLD